MLAGVVGVGDSVYVAVGSGLVVCTGIVLALSGMEVACPHVLRTPAILTQRRTASSLWVIDEVMLVHAESLADFAGSPSSILN